VKRKGVAARRGLKEARSEIATRRTEIGYEAGLAGRAGRKSREVRTIKRRGCPRGLRPPRGVPTARRKSAEGAVAGAMRRRPNGPPQGLKERATSPGVSWAQRDRHPTGVALDRRGPGRSRALSRTRGRSSHGDRRTRKPRRSVTARMSKRPCERSNATKVERSLPPWHGHGPDAQGVCSSRHFLTAASVFSMCFSAWESV
jgi:hypothetical protein